MAMLIGGIIAILLVIPGVLLKGLVFSQLWTWFIMPTFNVPPISVPVAIGISICVNVLRFNPATKSEQNELSTTLFLSVAEPLIALCFGWIVHLFI